MTRSDVIQPSSSEICRCGHQLYYHQVGVGSAAGAMLLLDCCFDRMNRASPASQKHPCACKKFNPSGKTSEY